MKLTKGESRYGEMTNHKTYIQIDNLKSANVTPSALTVKIDNDDLPVPY